MSGEQMYAVPVNYFVPTKSEVAQLQTEAGELRKEVEARETSWVDRTRAEQRLKSIETRIQAYRHEDRQAQAHQVQHTLATKEQVRPTLLQVQNASPPAPAGRYVLSDCGSAYLWIANTEQVGNVGGEPEQMYAECQ